MTLARSQIRAVAQVALLVAPALLAQVQDYLALVQPLLVLEVLVVLVPLPVVRALLALAAQAVAPVPQVQVAPVQLR